MTLDENNSGVTLGRKYIEKLKIPNDVALCPFITDTMVPTSDGKISTGVAYGGGACGGEYRASLTAGPSRGVFETAEVT